jgi:hypothetical protein
MKKRFWTIGLMTLMLTNCSVSTENIPSPDDLKMAIAKSISVPFSTTDTLVYRSVIGICGNSSRDEMNRHYEPYLNEAPYLDVLKKQFSGPVVVMGDSLFNVMMTHFETSKIDCGSPWECFSKNKIQLSLHGHAMTNSSVTIREMYTYKGQTRILEKLFIYKDGQWTFKITSEE